MPDVTEKKECVSLNDYIEEFIQADRELIEGIRKRVKTNKEGKVKPE